MIAVRKETSNLFEVPWNEDFKLLDGIAPYRDKVSCIYLPCADGHGLVTDRKGVSPRATKKAIREIQKAGFNPCVLLQRHFDIKYFSFYKELGVKYFTVGEDRIAEYIRDQLGDEAHIIASVTKDFNNEDYEEYAVKKPNLYDIFILAFRYSRDIESLMNLPKQLNYGLMPNLVCLWYCKMYRAHWFGQSESPFTSADIEAYGCKVQRYNKSGQGLDLNKSMYVPECDLWVFDPYIKQYKITHRSSRTQSIIDNLALYSSANIVKPDSQEIVDKAMLHYNMGHGAVKRAGDPIY